MGMAESWPSQTPAAWGTCWKNSDPEEQLPLGDQTGNVTDNGRWDLAGMSGGDTQQRDAAAGAGCAAVNTYRD